MPRQKILIAGASGLVGFAAIRHFSQLDDWEVVAVSRRVPRRFGALPRPLHPGRSAEPATVHRSLWADVRRHPSRLCRGQRESRRPGAWMARPRTDADQPGDDAQSVRAAFGERRRTSSMSRFCRAPRRTECICAAPACRCPIASATRAISMRTSTGCRRITSAANKRANAGTGPCSARNWLSARRSAAT